MPDRFDGTENYRANLEIKHGAYPAQPSTSGPDVGGLDNLGVTPSVKTAPNKSSGPTGGPEIGGCDQPGATIKSTYGG